MKAVIIANQWSRRGGLEVVTQDESKALSELGLEVTVLPVSGDRNCVAPRENIVVKWLAPTNRVTLSYWMRVKKLKDLAREAERILGEDGGLLLIGHTYLLPILDHLQHPERYAKWVWTHGVDAWGWEAQKWQPFMNRLDRIIAVSRYTAEHEKYAGVTKPISVVLNSIDTHRFVPTTTPEMIRRDEVMISGRITSVERYKGHDQLIEALPIASQKLGRPVSLRIVGTGDDVPRLQKKVKDLGLSNYVTFSGWVTDAQLLEAYQHCGVFAMPSRAEPRPERKDWAGEGFGLVYAEAEACGRPVVVSTDGGAPETLIDGETGYLADPRSPEATAEAIVKILRDPQSADEMGRRGHDFVNKAFSFETFKNRIAELLREDGVL